MSHQSDDINEKIETVDNFFTLSHNELHLIVAKSKYRWNALSINVVAINMINSLNKIRNIKFLDNN